MAANRLLPYDTDIVQEWVDRVRKKWTSGLVSMTKQVTVTGPLKGWSTRIARRLRDTSMFLFNCFTFSQTCWRRLCSFLASFSCALGEGIDASIIIMILLDVGLNVVKAYCAQRVVEDLPARVAPTAAVLRAGDRPTWRAAPVP